MPAVAYICDAVRTPFGRCGGMLADVRPDDLGAVPLRALMERNPRVDWSTLADVVLGCVSQTGEDNRNVARRSALLANLPESVPGMTVNRLCGSSLEAVALGAQAIKLREGSIMIAGGVESASRAPLVMPKIHAAFVRGTKLADTRTGWLFINPAIHARFGNEARTATAENVAREFRVSREDQDAFAYRSQSRMAAAVERSIISDEVVPVLDPKRHSVTALLQQDEHPRPGTRLEELARLKPFFWKGRTITKGNASADGDGACAVLLASPAAAKRFSLTPLARVVATARVGVAPRLAGMGCVDAVRTVLARTKLKLSQFDVLELDESFAAEALAVLRALRIPDDAPFVNPNGGAIALGHPMGATGARLVTTAVHELRRTRARRALCSMGIGTGQGIAMILERV
jgi:3-oxoadipyl-CoA thiolase